MNDSAGRGPASTRSYPGSTGSRPGRQLPVLGLATAVGSVGLAAGGTAGGLLATELTGDAATAGLPLGALVAGSAAAALALSRITARSGRGRALACGYAVGALGAAVVVATAGYGLVGVLVGSFLMGAANPAVFLARYAAAEVSAPGSRGRALGFLLACAAVGAIAGPNLLGPSGRFAAALGLSPLTGLYLVALVAFGLAALPLAGAAPTAAPTAARQPERAPEGQFWRPAGTVFAALAALAAANLVMVGIMTIAPVHLHHHGHSLELIGVAVSLHVAGMFAPAPVVGWLVDRFGARPVAASGAGLLALVAVGTAAVPPDAPPQVVAYLVLLGLAWNVTVVGGSALLVEALSPAVRLRGEAYGEVAMGLAALVGGAGAGVVLASAGFAVAGVIGGGVAMLGLAASYLGPRASRADRPAVPENASGRRHVHY